MLKNQFDFIQKEYEHLPSDEKEDLEIIVSSLSKLISSSNKKNIHDIKKYLLNKSKREEQYSEDEIKNIFALKKMVCAKNKYNENIHFLLNSIIWDLLKKLEKIQKNQELSNFIGHFLKVRISNEEHLTSREEIIETYKSYYDALPEEEQKILMKELAKSTFFAAKTAELRKFNFLFEQEKNNEF